MSKKQCMSCEKIVEYSSGIFNCCECSGLITQLNNQKMEKETFYLILMPKFCYLFVLLIISIMSMENRLITIYCKEIEDLYNFQRETQEKIFKQNQ